MDGLIIKHKWLELILSGKKTIEIRGSDTKKKGQVIYLLESGTSKVVGTSDTPTSKVRWVLIYIHFQIYSKVYKTNEFL